MVTYVFEAAGEEGEGEVGALVDELEPDGALAPVQVVGRVVGVLILHPQTDQLSSTMATRAFSNCHEMPR